MSEYVVYAITHDASAMVYIGIARMHPGNVVTTSFGDAIHLFKAALPRLQAYDNFTIKQLDEMESFEDAATVARQIIVRLKDHMPGKIINPIDKETRDAVDTGINVANDTLRAKAKARNIPYTTVYQRMKRGWSEAQALNHEYPPDRAPAGGRKKRIIEIDGVSKPYSQWCREAGISIETALARENRLKWPVEKAVTTPTQRGKKA